MGRKRPDILNICDRRNCKEKFSGWKAMPFGLCRAADAVFLSHWKYVEGKSIDTLC